MHLLPVSHIRQRQTADCLAACAAMVLDDRRVSYRYTALLQLLHIRDYGTAFSSLLRSEQPDLRVDVQVGDLTQLRTNLHNGVPVIVFLNTGMLSDRTVETGHAVVVIGMDDQVVVVHDPHLAAPARVIPAIEFEAAWIEQDQLCAVIRPVTPGAAI